MDDKQLLELAAKAAGNVDVVDAWRGAPSHFERNGLGWNPLTCNGDAFRLVSEFGMSVDCSDIPDAVVAFLNSSAAVASEKIVNGDIEAAARRAVVRVAAGDFD